MQISAAIIEKLSYKTLFKFSEHVRLRKCIWLAYICYRPLKISYQSLNVGLWPKIEGFCHLHAKLMVIFLKYLLLAVTQQCSAKVIYMGQCFFKY